MTASKVANPTLLPKAELVTTPRGINVRPDIRLRRRMRDLPVAVQTGALSIWHVDYSTTVFVHPRDELAETLATGVTPLEYR